MSHTTTHHACLSFIRVSCPLSLSQQSRGGAEAGHKRRDSNGTSKDATALLSKLSGRPPALSTDFSSLEQMAEEAEKEGGAGAQEDPARRRQSYFRVRLFWRGGRGRRG